MTGPYPGPVDFFHDEYTLAWKLLRINALFLITKHLYASLEAESDIL